MRGRAGVHTNCQVRRGPAEAQQQLRRRAVKAAHHEGIADRPKRIRLGLQRQGRGARNGALEPSPPAACVHPQRTARTIPCPQLTVMSSCLGERSQGAISFRSCCGGGGVGEPAAAAGASLLLLLLAPLPGCCSACILHCILLLSAGRRWAGWKARPKAEACAAGPRSIVELERAIVVRLQVA